jgi:transcription elongation factor Elf1
MKKVNSVEDRKRIIKVVFEEFPKITNCPFCNKICGNRGLLVMHMKACKDLEEKKKEKRE